MNTSQLDPQLVDKIVHEVKSQGVFDDFRKDTLADVDTKPAYQNLRQRVENTVKKFLSEQKWTPETNKYQLRERLRRHITESGFLDVGVERIVDQVVNPKIGSVFQPRIEEIAYKYLGIPLPPPVKYEQPPPPLIHPLPPLPLNGAALKVETESLLPNDLEQVSPDSEKATVKSECQEESSMDMDVDETPNEDDESPPFEPLVKCAAPVTNEMTKAESSHDLNVDTSDFAKAMLLPQAAEDTASQSFTKNRPLDAETQDTSISINTTELDSEKDEASRSFDITVAQESQLSQVSSDSRLSITSRNKSKSPADECEAVNISEEAQMPKFSENSSDANDSRPNTSELHFDIKKDEIKFEGTERKPNLLPETTEKTEHLVEHPLEESIKAEVSPPNNGNGSNETEKHFTDLDSSFQFGKGKVEVEVDADARSTPLQEKSFDSSLEETESAQLSIVEKSTIEIVTTSDKKDDSFTQTEDSPSVPAETQQQPEKIEKDATRLSSVSSSRHKKHSKNKRRSYEKGKDRERDKYKGKEPHKSKDRDRNRDKNNRSKNSSCSSSKQFSSTQKSAADAMNKSEKSANSAKHASLFYSSSSSSRSEVGSQPEPKRDERRGDGDKKQKVDSSYKDHSSNSSASKKVSDRKSAVTTDDHNELKEKVHRRKSTDSNDEDKNPGGGQTQKPSSAAKSSSKSKTKHTNEANSHSTKSSQNGTQGQTAALNHQNNVVILNDILQNPATNFIELEANAITNHLQVITSTSVVAADDTEEVAQMVVNSTAKTVEYSTVPAVTTQNKLELDDKLITTDCTELYFFEETSNQFTARLILLDNAMDRCRRVVNSLGAAQDYDSYDDVLGSNAKTICGKSQIDGDSCIEPTTTLLVDCIRYRGSHDHINFEAHMHTTSRKRFKHNDGIGTAKTSPTPSDVSFSSKENEAFDKYASVDTQKTGGVNNNDRHNIGTIKKLMQHQRYDSEDLYKPRPILSQRSRRRGVDSII